MYILIGIYGIMIAIENVISAFIYRIFKKKFKVNGVLNIIVLFMVTILYLYMVHILYLAFGLDKVPVLEVVY